MEQFLGVNVEELYRKYGPMVLRRCRQILIDEEMALDAMQEVFIRVLRREKDLSGWAPSSLLYTIATNTCLNVIRDNKRKGIRLDDKWLENIASKSDPQEQVLDRMVLDKIFEKEKDTTRLIAVLHYVDKMTLEETAHYVGMSVSGIRKRLARLKEVHGQEQIRNQDGKDEI